MEILIDGKWTDNDETYPFGAGRSVRLAFSSFITLPMEARHFRSKKIRSSLCSRAWNFI